MLNERKKSKERFKAGYSASSKWSSCVLSVMLSNEKQEESAENSWYLGKNDSLFANLRKEAIS